MASSHACGLVKNRAPFHLAALFQVFHDHGVRVQKSGGRVHQEIARHGGLSKNRAPYLTVCYCLIFSLAFNTY